MSQDRFLTGVERTFPVEDIIVSKTDRTGKITYANDIFLQVSGYAEDQVLGKPHSLVRHPEMPRCVFKLLWDVIETGEEIFAYVINRAINGDHYWVFAHVTPNIDASGQITGYHSSRRVPRPAALEAVKPIYRLLLEIENAAPDRKTGLERSHAAMLATLRDKGFSSYARFVFSLGR